MRIKLKEGIIMVMVLSLCMPFHVAVAQGGHTESFQEENKGTGAICIIDMIEKVHNPLTRMPGAVDGKAQAMVFSAKSLKNNSHVDDYDYGKLLNPGTR